MRRARTFGRLEILVLVALSFLGSPGWSQSINDLSDAKTPATGNLLLGQGAGASHTTGDYNTASGIDALFSNTTGSGSTAFGFGALSSSNATLAENTAVGYLALSDTGSGVSNTAIGYLALSDNLSGNQNTASGHRAMILNQSGNSNTAVGYHALSEFQWGDENTAIGHSALQGTFRLSTGGQNTAIGGRALYRNESGKRNVAVGRNAGARNTTGSGNVFIGRNAGNNSNYRTRSNRLVIANTKTTQPLIAGNFKAKTLRVYGAFSANSVKEVSDVRLKTGIAPLENGLSSVLRLEGKTYQWRKDPERVMPEGRAIGLIAQEVEEVLPELVSEDEDGFKGIEYSKLTAVLVEAIKEQQKQIEALRIRVDELES